MCGWGDVNAGENAGANAGANLGVNVWGRGKRGGVRTEEVVK